jgi:hypothetical protein
MAGDLRAGGRERGECHHSSIDLGAGGWFGSPFFCFSSCCVARVREIWFGFVPLQCNHVVTLSRDYSALLLWPLFSILMIVITM